MPDTPATPPPRPQKGTPPMITSFVLRPVARTIAVALTLADTVLATRIPDLPDWDEAGNPIRY